MRSRCPRSPFAIAAGIAGLAVVVALLLTGATLLHGPRRAPPSAGDRVSVPLLQSTDGTLDVSGRVSVVLTFASGLDSNSRENLRHASAVAPEVQRHGGFVIGLSVDELPVLQTVRDELALPFPLVSEGPGHDRHPLSEALGVFHGPPGSSDAPVDATGLFVIGGDGRIQRAVVAAPGDLLPPAALDGLP